MDVIINKSSVKSSGTKMIENADDFSREIDKFKEVVDKIALAWQGEDAKKYQEIMNEIFIPNMRELSNIMREYGEYLQSASNVYDALEEKFVEQKIEID